jgi:hypothetical protein
MKRKIIESQFLRGTRQQGSSKVNDENRRNPFEVDNHEKSRE